MWSSENSGTFDLDIELDLLTKDRQFKLKLLSKCEIRVFDQHFRKCNTKFLGYIYHQ